MTDTLFGLPVVTNPAENVDPGAVTFGNLDAYKALAPAADFTVEEQCDIYYQAMCQMYAKYQEQRHHYETLWQEYERMRAALQRIADIGVDFRCVTIAEKALKGEK